MSRTRVLNPQVAQTVAHVAGANRPATLKDAVVGFVDNSKLNADVFISRLQPMLTREFGIKPGVTVRKYAPKDELSESELVELAQCAVVVQCYGD